MLVVYYREESCWGSKSCMEGLQRHTGASLGLAARQGYCHPPHIPHRSWGFASSALSDADYDQLSSFAVFQSQFLPALSVQDTYQAITIALSEYLSILSVLISQAFLWAMLDYCLCYCKTPPHGSLGEAGCLVWSGCVRLIPMSWEAASPCPQRPWGAQQVKERNHSEISCLSMARAEMKPLILAWGFSRVKAAPVPHSSPLKKWYQPTCFPLLMVFLSFAGGAAHTTRQGAPVLGADSC